MRSALVPGERLTTRKIRALGIGTKAAQRIRFELEKTGEIVKTGELYLAA